MTKKHLIPFLLLPFFAAPAAQAEIDLIAIGEVDANYQDLSTRTAGPLENGVAGNLLGGVGSGLAYAGGNRFLAIPDRGPNTTSYNALVDDTTSFINRFQTFNLALAANPGYDPLDIGSLPYILSPFLIDTKLLSSSTPLKYATNGTPALNKRNTIISQAAQITLMLPKIPLIIVMAALILKVSAYLTSASTYLFLMNTLLMFTNLTTIPVAV